VLSAAKLKVTTLLRPDELKAVSAGEGQRVVLHVKLADGRVLTADIAAKSLRRAQMTIWLGRGHLDRGKGGLRRVTYADLRPRLA
jgi:hypothetical protein